MNPQAFTLGFVNQCLDEGFTIKEASKLCDVMLKLAAEGGGMPAPNLAKAPIAPPKVKTNPVFKPTAKPAGNMLPPPIIPAPGANVVTQAPHYNPPIEKVPI